MSAVREVDGVWKTYRGPSGDLVASHGISLVVGESESLGIVG